MINNFYPSYLLFLKNAFKNIDLGVPTVAQWVKDLVLLQARSGGGVAVA